MALESAAEAELASLIDALIDPGGHLGGAGFGGRLGFM